MNALQIFCPARPLCTKQMIWCDLLVRLINIKNILNTSEFSLFTSLSFPLLSDL